MSGGTWCPYRQMGRSGEFVQPSNLQQPASDTAQVHLTYEGLPEHRVRKPACDWFDTRNDRLNGPEQTDHVTCGKRDVPPQNSVPKTFLRSIRVQSLPFNIVSNQFHPSKCIDPIYVTTCSVVPISIKRYVISLSESADRPWLPLRSQLAAAGSLALLNTTCIVYHVYPSLAQVCGLWRVLPIILDFCLAMCHTDWVIGYEQHRVAGSTTIFSPVPHGWLDTKVQCLEPQFSSTLPSLD